MSARFVSAADSKGAESLVPLGVYVELSPLRFLRRWPRAPPLARMHETFPRDSPSATKSRKGVQRTVGVSLGLQKPRGSRTCDFLESPTCVASTLTLAPWPRSPLLSSGPALREGCARDGEELRCTHHGEERRRGFVPGDGGVPRARRSKHSGWGEGSTINKFRGGGDMSRDHAERTWLDVWGVSLRVALLPSALIRQSTE